MIVIVVVVAVILYNNMKVSVYYSIDFIIYYIKFCFLFLFVSVCSGKSITVWLFLGYVTRYLMRVGRLLKTKDCEC